MFFVLLIRLCWFYFLLIIISHWRCRCFSAQSWKTTTGSAHIIKIMSSSSRHSFIIIFPCLKYAREAAAKQRARFTNHHEIWCKWQKLIFNVLTFLPPKPPKTTSWQSKLLQRLSVQKHIFRLIIIWITHLPTRKLNVFRLLFVVWQIESTYTFDYGGGVVSLTRCGLYIFLHFTSFYCFCEWFISINNLIWGNFREISDNLRKF